MSTNGLKKTASSLAETIQTDVLELDELYWFIKKKADTETRENVYVITMISRQPRQIVGFDVGLDKTAERIQKLVDSAPEADKYCTDGYNSYLDVVFPGEHVRNIHNKKDTFTVEGINADLRHFILPAEVVLTPLPIEDDISSLSAILLDDGYYNFLKSGVRVIDGLPVLDTEHIIPFKAKAWLDLSERKANGGQVDSKHIKKHKNNVITMSGLLSATGLLVCLIPGR